MCARKRAATKINIQFILFLILDAANDFVEERIHIFVVY